MSKTNCVTLTNYEDTAIHAVFHVMVLVIVLTAFFFIVVENIEREALTDELVGGIKNGLKNVHMSKDEVVYTKLKKLANLYKKPSATNKAYNNSLYFISISVIITLAMILITLILTLKYSSNKCVHLLDIILKNILLFICVGVVEYLFFINIGMNFVPVEPSYINMLITKTINE